MDNTNYNLLASQIAAFNKVNTIANNIANTNTPGYKTDNMLFEKYLTQDVHDNNTMPQDRVTLVDTRDGQMRTTGRQLDFALVGNGFFMVQTPLGIRYTRNGSFVLNNNYEVVTPDGKNLLSENGDVITLDQDDTDIMVDVEGVVFARRTPQENYQERGKIGIASFTDQRLLRKAGDSSFMIEGDNPNAVEMADSTQYKVFQGRLEESNVIPTNEMSSLIEIQGHNQTLASSIKIVRSIGKSAYDTIAKQQ